MSLWQTPAIVVALLIWLNTPPASLADAARREALRRQLMPKATRVLTNEDVDRVPARPLPTAPPAADVSSAVPTPAAPDAPRAPEAARDEAWWRDRMVAARETLARDEPGRGEDARIAGAETEAGLAFPVVAEPVDLVEFDTAVTVDEVGEHASPSHRGELVGIPDKDDPPAVLVGEPGQPPLLQPDIVGIVQVVNPDDGVPFLEQPSRDVRSDKPGRAGD